MNKKEEESNIWYVVCLLLIYFFLFQHVHIFIIATTDRCTPHTEFWFALNGFTNVYWQSLSIFILFFVWSALETVRAWIFSYKDKISCIIVSVMVLACNVIVSVGAWVQVESYKVMYEGKPYSEYKFKPKYMLIPEDAIARNRRECNKLTNGTTQTPKPPPLL